MDTLLSAVWNEHTPGGTNHGIELPQRGAVVCTSSEGTKRAGNFDHSRIQGLSGVLTHIPPSADAAGRYRTPGSTTVSRLYFLPIRSSAAFADTDNARSDSCCRRRQNS